MSQILKFFKKFRLLVFNQSIKIENKYLQFNLSLRQNIILLIVFIILVPMSITSVYFYLILADGFSDRVKKDMSLLMQQINETVDSQFSGFYYTTQLVLYNQVINEELENEKSSVDELEYIKSKIRTEAALRYCTITNDAVYRKSDFANTLIREMYIFKSNSVFFEITNGTLSDSVIERDNKRNQDLYAYSVENKIDRIIIPPDNKNQIICFIHNIKNISTMRSIGKLIINVDENSISNIYKNVLTQNGAKWYLIDNESNILSSSDKTKLGEKINLTLFVPNSSSIENEYSDIEIEGEHYIAGYKNINNYGMTSIIVIPKKFFYPSVPRNLLNYLYIILAVIVISLLIGLRLSYKFTKPLKDLSKKLELFGDGNFDIKMPSYKYPEIMKLSNVFNKMTSKINFLVNDVYQKQLLLQESELKSLQSQMNPHFLFNVLVTISLHAKMSKNETIYKMITSLSQLLQANVNFNNNDKVTIRDELKYIDFYLYLQNIRLGDKVKYKMNIENEALLDLLIPKFCIQPLVENSIIHGFDGIKSDCNLSVTVEAHSGFLFITVIDNGNGFDAVKIDLDKNLNNLLQESTHNHIALHNINKRIKLLYGNKYGMIIESTLGSGCKVTLQLPFMEEGF